MSRKNKETEAGARAAVEKQIATNGDGDLGRELTPLEKAHAARLASVGKPRHPTRYQVLGRSRETGGACVLTLASSLRGARKWVDWNDMIVKAGFEDVVILKIKQVWPEAQ